MGIPTNEEAICTPSITYTKLLFEGFSSVCVNVFVCISGWFGIKLTGKKVWNLVFQFLYFSFFLNVFLILLGLKEFTVLTVIEALGLTRSYWFFKSYLFLMLLSPVLNTFIENGEKKVIEFFIIGFVVFQTIFSWLFDAVSWIDAGQSPLSFIGLYILAGYLRRYKTELQKKPVNIYITFYLVLTIGIVTLPYVTIRMGLPLGTCHMFISNSPFVILASIILLLLFNKFNFQSKTINRVAQSCFAVYLVHQMPFISRNFYCRQIHEIYDIIPFPLSVIILILFLSAVFIIAVILDQPRIYIWKRMKD